MKYLVILFILIPSYVTAQPSIFDPSHVKWENTDVANKLSNIGVGIGIGLDVVDVFKSEDKKHASIVLAERYLVILAVTEIGKRIVHRTRPDGSDRKSWPSEHTAFGSGRWYIGIPVGYSRMAADKHYLTDVVSGFVIRKVTDKFIK
jgi:membrane-associated phospholipid phosphatase